MDRAAGILLSISSLPSPYGIGSLGRAAYDFADFLAAAGQKYWQVLPVGPISYGDSPYQSFSAFAGNPYYIDLDLLIADGLLTPAEAAAPSWGGQARYVDYGAVYESRFALLEKAFRRGWDRDAAAVAAFSAENAGWLADYALFMACKRRFDMTAWTQWPEDIRLRRPEAVERWRAELDEDVRFFTYLQFLFEKQWSALRAYVHKKHVKLIGDMPIYVAMDSADVWASPRNFLLDEKNVPSAVAGVPPDAFTADGQLWGNPLYDWERMAADGFSWWERRLRGGFARFDVVRLDHFRGLESYWSVPYGDPTAATGHWVKGPDSAFIRMLHRRFPHKSIIAEDLGYITPEVQAMLSLSGYPGMKVLEFAFDHREPSNYPPHRYERNCVCYTGTHDNATLRGWMEDTAPEDLDFARRYTGAASLEELDRAILRSGMASVARLFVAQMQDYLRLGAEGRMNTPGVPAGNWRWRLLPGEASPALAKELRALTKLYER